MAIPVGQGRAHSPRSLRPQSSWLRLRCTPLLESLETRDLLTASPASLGLASDFNLFLLGNSQQTYTDVQGRVAVAGNASYAHVGVATGIANSQGLRDDLIVGGNLTFISGQVTNGNVVYGGSANLSSFGTPNGSVRQDTPINFTAAANDLAARSQSWFSWTPNGSVADIYGNLQLNGASTEFNVFSVSADQLAQTHSVTINAPSGSSVLVNVTGSQAQMQYFGMALNGVDRQHVLFNFAQANSLKLAGISVQGSVLAPAADVVFSNGNLEGTLVANNLTGNGEFHWFPGLFDLPTPVVTPEPNPTPEPGPGPSPAPEPEPGPVPEPVLTSLSGTVFVDQDRDGVNDDSEIGLGNITITLSGNGQQWTTTTDQDGRYTFENLTPGDYTVRQTQPLGYGSSTENSIDVTLTDVGATDLDFGETTATLAGSVYIDANNDGVRHITETGIKNVTVTLTGTDVLGGKVSKTTTTDATGAYSFTGLLAGTYQVQETQPTTHLDGKDRLGTSGGTLGNDVFKQITLIAGATATDYQFGEICMASLKGFVYIDTNNDGIKQANEVGIAGAIITLYGADDMGTKVNRAVATGSDGSYSFTGLRPGTYTLTERQPANTIDGKDKVGTQGGTAGNDTISSIVLKAAQVGSSNNFGEQSVVAIAPATTATIGYWQNKNGQALIKSFNSGPTSKTLANWLASNFPNLYGATSRENLTGQTNEYVADYFVRLFNQTGQKLEAQILAVALNCYASSTKLGGVAGAKAGFNASDPGLLGASYNVGANGSAFGVSNNSYLSVWSILTTINSKCDQLGLFGGNQSLGDQANVVCTGINEAAHV